MALDSIHSHATLGLRIILTPAQPATVSEIETQARGLRKRIGFSSPRPLEAVIHPDLCPTLDDLLEELAPGAPGPRLQHVHFALPGLALDKLLVRGGGIAPDGRRIMSLLFDPVRGDPGLAISGGTGSSDTAANGPTTPCLIPSDPFGDRPKTDDGPLLPEFLLRKADGTADLIEMLDRHAADLEFQAGLLRQYVRQCCASTLLQAQGELDRSTPLREGLPVH